MKRIVVPAILTATVLIGGLMAYVIWKASPATAQDYLKSGKQYFEQKKYPASAVQFLNAVQKDPRNRDARFFLALSYYNMANLNASAKELIALLEYYPDDLDAKLRLGSIYLAGGGTERQFFQRAREIAQDILSKQPDNVAALILSGNASIGLQDYRTSTELFEKAVSLDPKNTAAFVSLGTTEALQTNYAEAEKAF